MLCTQPAIEIEKRANTGGETCVHALGQPTAPMRREDNNLTQQGSGKRRTWAVSMQACIRLCAVLSLATASRVAGAHVPTHSEARTALEALNEHLEAARCARSESPEHAVPRPRPRDGLEAKMQANAAKGLQRASELRRFTLAMSGKDHRNLAAVNTTDEGPCNATCYNYTCDDWDVSGGSVGGVCDYHGHLLENWGAAFEEQWGCNCSSACACSQSMLTCGEAAMASGSSPDALNFTCANSMGTIVSYTCDGKILNTNVTDEVLRCAVEELANTVDLGNLTVVISGNVHLNGSITLPPHLHLNVHGHVSLPRDQTGYGTTDAWSAVPAWPPGQNGSLPGYYYPWLYSWYTSDRLFIVSHGASLHLNNVVLGGGFTDEAYGGLIYSLGGHVSAEFCVFAYGMVNEGSLTSATTQAIGGGAIFTGYHDPLRRVNARNLDFSLTVKNCLFTENWVSSSRLTLKAAGGAIFVSDDCRAPYCATIDNGENNKLRVRVTQTRFANNTAKSYRATPDSFGGGIFLEAQDSGRLHAHVTEAEFWENSANFGGAAAVGYGVELTMSDSSFIQNHAVDVASFGGGGALYTHNKALLSLTNVSGTGNVAHGAYGGGFLFANDGSSVSLRASSLSENVAYRDHGHNGSVGGALSVFKAEASLHDSALRENEAGVGSSVMVEIGSLFAHETDIAVSAPQPASVGYLVHGYLKSGLTIDTCNVHAPGADGRAIASDERVVLRNSDVAGAVVRAELVDVDMSFAKEKESTRHVASCRHVDDEPGLRCSTEYCTDIAIGIECYCPTIYGPRDPAWEGCDDPPLVSVFLERLDRFSSKPDSIQQTFFFKNDGEDVLSWHVDNLRLRRRAWAQGRSTYVAESQDLELMRDWRVYPLEGNLSSCETGNVTIELSSSTGTPAFQAFEYTVDLVSNAYPFHISGPDYSEYTPVNTTVPIMLSVEVSANMDAALSFIQAGNGTRGDAIAGPDTPDADALYRDWSSSQSSASLNGTAGGRLSALVKPIDVAGQWIRGSTGDEKLTAKLARPPASGTTADELNCLVSFLPRDDAYLVDCELDPFAAGDFELSVLVVGDESSGHGDLVGAHRIPAQISCPSSMMYAAGDARRGQTPSCGCAPGQVLNVGSARCTACDAGSFSIEKATKYSPNPCIPCMRLVPGSRTHGEGLADGQEDCTCTAAYYKRWARDYEGDDTVNVSLALDRDEHVASCTMCPDGTKCPTSGLEVETMIIKPGFWRSSLESEKVLPCPEPSVCVGSNQSATLCAPNHEGPFCAACQEGYFRGLEGGCTTCDGVDSNGVLAGLVLLLSLAVLIPGCIGLCAWREARRSQRIAASYTEEEAARIEREKTKSASVGNHALRDLLDAYSNFTVLDYDTLKETSNRAKDSMKIVIGELQLSATLQGNLFTNLPSVQIGTLSALKLVSLDIASLLPLACIVNGYNYHITFLVNTVQPLALFGVLGVFIVSARGRPGLARAADYAGKFVMLYSYFIYANVTGMVFNMYSCQKLDDGHRYLIVDYSIDCDSKGHRAFEWVAALMMLVYPIGLPAAYYALMWPHKDKLSGDFYIRQARDQGEKLTRAEAIEKRNDDKELGYMRFLFYQYSGGMFYFEMLECARKVILCGILTFISPASAAQPLFAMLLFFICFAVLACGHPYADERDTKIAIVAYVTTFLAVLCGFIFMIQEDKRVDQPGTFQVLVVGATFAPLIVSLFITADDARTSIQGFREAQASARAEAGAPCEALPTEPNAHGEGASRETSQPPPPPLG